MVFSRRDRSVAVPETKVVADDRGPDRADLSPPSRLELPYESAEVTRSSLIEGFVTNCSSATWNENYKIGLRHFRDGSGQDIAFELRLPFVLSGLEPGGRVYFRFDLGSVDLPGDAVDFTMDIVEEGQSWMADRGSSPAVFRIAPDPVDSGALWSEFFADGRVRLDPVAARKLSLIESTIPIAPPLGGTGIERLAKLLADWSAGRSVQPIRADSRCISQSLRSTGTTDPKAAFIRHFAILTGQPVTGDDPEALAAVFASFVVHSEQLFGCGSIPLPDDLTEWLSGRALPPALASSPITRAMVITMGREAGFSLHPAGGGRQQQWAFVEAVMIFRNLALSAMGESLLRMATEQAFDVPSDAIFPAVTQYIVRRHEQVEAPLEFFDLETDAGRLTYTTALLIEGLENEVQRALAGTEVERWFLDPLSGEPGGVSAMEVILLMLLKRDPPSGFVPNADVNLLRREVSWFQRSGRPQPAADVRVLGLHNSSSGLSANMRMSIEVLQSLGFALEIADSGSDRVHQVQAPATSRLLRLRRPVDLFHLNLDNVPQLICRYAKADRQDVYRIAFTLWETSAIPEQHRLGLELIDEVWAPSEFVADVYRAASHPNVHVIGKGIALPSPRPFDLTRIGIEKGICVFLTSFDVGSWIERKDPVAAVRAFQEAFPDQTDVRLVIKSNGLFDHPGDKTGQVEKLREAARRDRRIILFSELLPFAEYLGLIQAADAIVSPHRAEGFGYLPAYAMLLGTAVVVTDFSGTRDFCTEETSFPVEYREVPLEPGEFVFDAKGATWARVDVSHLAKRMREVRDDPAEAARRTERGRTLVSERYSMKAMADRYRERLSGLMLDEATAEVGVTA